MSFKCPEFERVRTYEDLIDINIAFLKGEINQTPYHGGPIDQETVPLVKKLVELNKLGLITVNGQPAVALESGYNPRFKFWQMSQRPFLDGYLPKQDLPELLEFLRTQPEYVYSIWDLKWYERKNGWWDRLFSKSPIWKVNMDLIETTMPNGWDLTLQRSASTELALAQTDWEVYTRYPSTSMSPPYDFQEYTGINTVLIPHAVFLNLAGKNFGDGSTEDLMLKFFHSKLRKDSKHA